MKKSFKNVLSSYPESKRERFSKRLTKFEFRASLFLEEFSASILKHLKDNNGKKADIAERLNISRSAVTQLLDPKTNISILKVFELAEAVGMTPDFFDMIEITECLEVGIEVENESQYDFSTDRSNMYMHSSNKGTIELISNDTSNFTRAGATS